MVFDPDFFASQEEKKGRREQGQWAERRFNAVLRKGLFERDSVCTTNMGCAIIHCKHFVWPHLAWNCETHSEPLFVITSFNVSGGEERNWHLLRSLFQGPTRLIM